MHRNISAFLSTSLLLVFVFSYGCSNKNPDVGSVVTLAKSGYGNSVFESSEEKCQHCHYDLYDTWKSSMHAQSWSDPIFQTLYQGYLALLMESKIGVSGPTGEINIATAQKMATICLTCHAPSAVYSKDFNITIEQAGAQDTSSNPAASYNPNSSAIVVAGKPNANTGVTYKATYQIGHKNNLEGISCSFCHSIEAVRMTHAGDTYSLAAAIKTAPAIGNVIYPAGATLHFSTNSGSADMNAFFQLTGPELHADFGATRNSKLTGDGRFLMKSIPLTDEAKGQVHAAGGPYYGPFGVYGLHNDYSKDQTDRNALVDSTYSSPGNHFEDMGKALCLACHQRSAKVLDPGTGSSRFMELCTTWTVTDDNLYSSPLSGSGTASPKCQKCHMEKRKGLPLNDWYSSGKATDLSGVSGEMISNIQDNIFPSHQFEGGSVPAKMKAGFSSLMSATLDGGMVNIQTSLLNKTAHMLPGAHPMRRVLTMARVKDANGVNLTLAGASIVTDYEDVNYTYNGANSAGGVNLTMPARAGRPPYQFAGFVDVPNGPVGSQWFADGSKRIIEDGAADRFVRIYGRETIDAQSGVVKPGFASNSAVDNRLQPNERESFSVFFDASSAAMPITVEYRVYYMRKGASGVFPLDQASGFLNSAENSSKKLGIMEVASHTVTLN